MMFPFEADVSASVVACIRQDYRGAIGNLRSISFINICNLRDCRLSTNHHLPVLAYPNFEEEFTLLAAASGDAFGAVLEHKERQL